MRKVLVHTAWLLLFSAAACAPRMAPLPVVTSPRFPDFVPPAVPAASANTPEAERHRRGWTFLQAGDLGNAGREFSAALELAPLFYPAEIGLGLVQLADGNPREALGYFDRVLDRRPGEAAALVGRGEASLGLDREAEALAAFAAAVAADPALANVARRVEVLRFRVAQQQLQAARAAAASGRLDEAVDAYTTAIAGSPDSSILYRELGGVERQRGNEAAALEHLRKAVELAAFDTASLVAIGEILEAQGDFDGAIRAYSDALAIDPTAQVRTRLEMVRARAERARLPVEYRAIDDAPQITRGDLAALIGVRLAPLLQPMPGADTELITDIRTDWASSWILAVTRAGVMEPFANHAFQPGTPVRRIDLAEAIDRLLTRIAVPKPALAQAWRAALVKFPDLASGHLAYPAASAAVASGVLPTDSDGSLRPFRVVSGEEAIEVIERLERLAGLPSPPRASR